MLLNAVRYMQNRRIQKLQCVQDTCIDDSWITFEDSISQIDLPVVS